VSRRIDSGLLRQNARSPRLQGLLPNGFTRRRRRKTPLLGQEGLGVVRSDSEQNRLEIDRTTP
jgi:hypothetical protein